MAISRPSRSHWPWVLCYVGKQKTKKVADCLANVLGLSWHNMAPTQLIKSDPCIYKSDSFEKWNSSILQQNLHWKLGQQTPSFGSLLEYLETMA